MANIILIVRGNRRESSALVDVFVDEDAKLAVQDAEIMLDMIYAGQTTVTRGHHVTVVCGG